MSDKDTFTDRFFAWAKEHGFSSRDIANELGKSRVVISNWRAKGTPKGAEYACTAFMEKVARGKNILSVETAQDAMQTKLDGMRSMLNASTMAEGEKMRLMFVAGLDVGASLGIHSSTITAQAIVNFEGGNS
jgi:hypothetical protein